LPQSLIKFSTTYCIEVRCTFSWASYHDK